MKSLEKSITKLTLEAIQNWAGSKVTSRGRDYWNSGKVQNLVHLPDGTILASVQGSRTYTTTVQLKKEILSQCTCPYGSRCKHAVAILYQLIELKKSKTVPDFVKHDDRMDWLDSDDKDEFDADLESGQMIAKGISTKKALQSTVKYLHELNEQEAKELLVELASNIPSVYDAIQAKRRLEKGDTQSIWREIRQQMESLRNGPDWSSRSGRWGASDSSKEEDAFAVIEKCLTKLNVLLDHSKIIAFGKEFFAFLSDYITMYDQDGETYGLADKALKQLDMGLQKAIIPGSEKLERMDQWIAWDEYNAWEGPSRALMKTISKQDWNQYLEKLLARLDSTKDTEQRTRLLQTILLRLPHSSIARTRLELLETYAQDTYLEKVLIAEWKKNKSFKKIVTFLVEKMSALAQDEWSLKTYYNDLEYALLAMNRKAEAIAMRRDLFLQNPSLESSQQLLKMAKGLAIQKKIKTCVLRFLETGNTTELKALLSGKSPISTEPKKNTDKRANKAPFAQVLYGMALQDRNVDEAVRWYDYQIKHNTSHGNLDSDRFVKLIADKYPERAITYWKRSAEGLIAQTNPRAYETACVYLEKLIRLCVKKKRTEDWKAFEQNLRETHKRKVSFIQSLDGLVNLVGR